MILKTKYAWKKQEMHNNICIQTSYLYKCLLISNTDNNHSNKLAK